jgi:hypothetical protein
MKKWVHELNRELSKEGVQMASKYTKKGLMSLVIKETQIKTTLRFHLTPVRMAISKGNNKKKCWQGCGKTGIWECKFPTTMESSMEIPQKLEIELLFMIQ